MYEMMNHGSESCLVTCDHIFYVQSKDFMLKIVQIPSEPSVVNHDALLSQ
jgi:hypothetical protein